MCAGVSSAAPAGARGTAASGATACTPRAPRRGSRRAARRDLLRDHAGREDRGEVVGPGGLQRAGVQRRQRRLRQIGREVDPVRRQVALVERERRRLVVHRNLPVVAAGRRAIVAIAAQPRGYRGRYRRCAREAGNELRGHNSVPGDQLVEQRPDLVKLSRLVHVHRARRPMAHHAPEPVAVRSLVAHAEAPVPEDRGRAGGAGLAQAAEELAVQRAPVDLVGAPANTWIACQTPSGGMLEGTRAGRRRARAVRSARASRRVARSSASWEASLQAVLAADGDDRQRGARIGREQPCAPARAAEQPVDPGQHGRPARAAVAQQRPRRRDTRAADPRARRRRRRS